MGIRLELMKPGLQYFHDPHIFNVFTTAHGLIMIFFMVMPARSADSATGSSRS